TVSRNISKKVIPDLGKPYFKNKVPSVDNDFLDGNWYNFNFINIYPKKNNCTIPIKKSEVSSNLIKFSGLLINKITTSIIKLVFITLLMLYITMFLKFRK